ncbi:MAG: hypothetical protein OXG08_12400 [Gammaproteobacteria bacterium]|nr:hypothetical protein [Gammaproteobacteria bacterium]
MAIRIAGLIERLANFRWADVFRYLVEFLIVFVGIYLAFLLTDYQEEFREREIQVKYYESLILEFRALALHLDAEEPKILKHLAIVEEIEQGNRPIIPVSNLVYAFQDGVVDAAFSGRNFEALDKGILGAIITGRPALEALDRSIRMLNGLTAELLPIQMADEDCCYDEEDNLLPLLEWYPHLTREIYAINRQLRVVVLERAIPDLEQSMQALQ